MPTFTSYKSGLQVPDEPTYRTHLAIYMDYPNSVLLNQWGVGMAFDPNVGLSVNGSFGGSTNGIVASTISGYALIGNATGSGYGVRGYNAAGYGVGVEGVSVNNVGVLGSSTNGIGVLGIGPIGVYGKSSDATSGSFALQCVNVASSNLFTVKGDASSWFYGLIKNGAGTTIMDINGGFSIHNNAGNPVIYLGAAQLYTNGGLETLDWANRRVKNSTGVITIGWEACELKDAANVSSMLWSSRLMYGNTGAIVIDYSKPATIKLPALQTGNAGLATGETYIDTAANILANGDKIVGIKV